MAQLSNSQAYLALLAVVLSLACGQCTRLDLEGHGLGFLEHDIEPQDGSSENQSNIVPQHAKQRLVLFNPSSKFNVKLRDGPFLKSSIIDFSQDQFVQAATKAYLVSNKVSLENPTLRVLLYTFPSEYDSVNQQTYCGLLNATLQLPSSHFHPPLTATQSCTVAKNGLGGSAVCDLMVPTEWWQYAGKTKAKKGRGLGTVLLAYKMVTSKLGECQGGDIRSDYSPWLPLDSQAQLEIPPAEELSSKEPPALREKRSLLEIIQMDKNVFPNSKAAVPVKLNVASMRNLQEEGVYGIKIRIRVRSDMHILDLTPTPNAPLTSLTSKASINRKQTLAEVNVMFSDIETVLNESSHSDTRLIDLLTCVFGIDDVDPKAASNGLQISWHITFLAQNITTTDLATKSKALGFKKYTRFIVQKDQVMAVFPILRNSEILNLASVTGDQQSELLKVIMVSAAGKIADVTLQSTCNTSDKNSVKVSSSCTSVYTDGSEAPGGALRAQISATYGGATGTASLVVWAPKLPLRVEVEDSELARIKSGMGRKCAGIETDKMRSPLSGQNCCRKLYQETRIHVYAQFIATDSDSGRNTVFPSRSTELDISDQVAATLAISSGEVAALKGLMLEGLRPGSVDIQVISSISGEVLGQRSVSVTSDEVSLVSVRAQIVSDMNIDIKTLEQDKYLIQTVPVYRFTSVYQVGYLNLRLSFSDGSQLSLWHEDRHINSIRVKALKSQVLNLMSPKGDKYLRMIALSDGSGPLVEVFLDNSCLEIPSTSRVAYVNAVVSISPSTYQATMDSMLSLSTLPDVPLRDQQDLFSSSGQEAQRRSHSASSKKSYSTSSSSPSYSVVSLETVAYASLAIVCASFMLILVASCYIPRMRQKNSLVSSPTSFKAKEWVWMGSHRNLENGLLASQPSPEAKPDAEAQAFVLARPPRATRRVLPAPPQLPPKTGRLRPASISAGVGRSMQYIPEDRPAQDMPTGLMSPLRQSPASALPPLLGVENVESQPRQPKGRSHMEHDDYLDTEYNPDLKRATPPRKGAFRLFDNPFDGNNEECAPVDPEQLSPTHIFELISSEDDDDKMDYGEQPAKKGQPRIIDSSTFTKHKGRSPQEETIPVSYEEDVDNREDEDGDECSRGDESPSEAMISGSDAAPDLDYERLMLFFEALKESNA